MKQRGIMIWLLLSSTLLWSPFGVAAVHKCTDDSGRVVFQDKPCSDSAPPPPAPATAKTATVDNTVAVPATGSGRLLWVLRSSTATVYMLGSIHFGQRQMYPLPPLVMEAYEDSSALAVELDLGGADAADMAQFITAKGMYADGGRLKEHVSAETWALLEQVSASQGLPLALLERQKPWFVAMSLLSLALKRDGYSEEYGVEQHFLKRARGSKRIIELETLAQQLDIFDSFSVEDQDIFLRHTLRDLERSSEHFATMLQLWQRGDESGLNELINDSIKDMPGGDRLFQALLVQRNATMAGRIEEMVRRGGRYFVVVGAGHFLGEQGIVAQLRGQGHHVDRF